MIVYKIKDTVTGLYSRGGTWPTFSKTGKVWRNKSALGNHLVLVMEGRDKSKYKDCVIEPYELVETSFTGIPVDSYYDPIKERRAIKQKESELAWKKYREDLERAEFERLKSKFK